MDFFSKCDQIRSLLRTWLNLLKKSLMESLIFKRIFIFCAVKCEKSQECLQQSHLVIRGGSRTAATSKMELFVIIVNGFQWLTIMTKCFILDVEAVLDPPLVISFTFLLIEPSLFYREILTKFMLKDGVKLEGSKVLIHFILCSVIVIACRQLKQSIA